MGKIAELEVERNELQFEVRTIKAEMTTKLQKVESEFTTYRSTVETKLASFTQLDEDVFRLRAEIEELKLRNDRM